MPGNGEIPLRFVRRQEDRFPGIWQQLDRANLELLLPSVPIPDYCFAPLLLAGDFLMRREERRGTDIRAQAAVLTAAYSWRRYRTVYRFARSWEVLTENGAEEVMAEDTAVFRRLPEPAVFLRTHVFPDSAGFFAWMDYSPDTGDEALCLLAIDRTGEMNWPCFLPVEEGIPVGEVLLGGKYAKTEEKAENKVIRLMPPAVRARRAEFMPFSEDRFLTALRMLTLLCRREVGIVPAEPVTVYRHEGDAMQQEQFGLADHTGVRCFRVEGPQDPH